MSLLHKRPYFREVNLEDELKTERDLQGFLAAAAELDDPKVLQAAIGEVARIRGMREVAEQSGLNEKSLYRALSKRGNPRLDTLKRVLDVLGFKLSIVPKDAVGVAHAPELDPVIEALKAKLAS